MEAQEIGKLAALQVDATEELRITATEETELYLLGLPPVEVPETDPDNFDYCRCPGQRDPVRGSEGRAGRQLTRRPETTLPAPYDEKALL
ncbi:hypothetical protein [Actinacidiphila soli]|uniref:hypothetical protein n=1 Tax=Actinacidiphila soli TaxID=2487275 RepID=UPI000FCC1E53|nr:hypothetical protein [Actinacidiphila soli]